MTAFYIDFLCYLWYNIYNNIGGVLYKMSKRKFRMYCIDISNDGSEFELRFELNGDIVDKITEYSFDDVLIDSYNFFHQNCEKYRFDGRFDELTIEISHKF